MSRPFDELANDALDGRLDAAESAMFAQWLERSEACRAEWAQLQALKRELGALGCKPAPDSLHGRVMGHVDSLTPGQVSTWSHFRKLGPLRWAAMILAFVGAGFVLWQEGRSRPTPDDQSRRETAAWERQAMPTAEPEGLRAPAAEIDEEALKSPATAAVVEAARRSFGSATSEQAVDRAAAEAMLADEMAKMSLDWAGTLNDSGVHHRATADGLVLGETARLLAENLERLSEADVRGRGVREFSRDVRRLVEGAVAPGAPASAPAARPGRGGATPRMAVVPGSRAAESPREGQPKVQVVVPRRKFFALAGPNAAVSARSAFGARPVVELREATAGVQGAPGYVLFEVSGTEADLAEVVARLENLPELSLRSLGRSVLGVETRPGETAGLTETAAGTPTPAPAPEEVLVILALDR